MIRLAFYRAYAKGHPWWSRFVDLASGGGGLTHVELVFEDGMSFSSSGMDPAPGMGDQCGVRAKFIDYQANPEQWRIMGLFPELNAERRMREYAEQLVAEGHGYDWNAVYRFVLPWMKEHPSKYMCSEFCLEVLRAGGLLLGDTPAYQVSPNGLFKLLGGRS